jgi:signal peptidase I
VTAGSRWPQQAGRALTQARPATALLLAPLFVGVAGLLHGGSHLLLLLALVPASVLGALSAQELARLDRHGLARAAGGALVVVAVVCFWAVALGPRLLGYETMTVLSGSMQPTFNPGDVVLVTMQPTASVRAGQIISFHIPTGDHHVVTHRVADVVSGGKHPVIQSKGDGNTTVDPWKARLLGPSVWRYRMRVRYAGYPLLELRRPMVKDACLYGAPTLFVLLMLGEIWLPVRFRAGMRRKLRRALP